MVRFLCTWIGVFLLQATLSFVNNASALYVMWYSEPGSKVNAFQIIGIIVWITGQVFEILGDK